MKRPYKPHQDGYEDDEDCDGYYDPDEAERRWCHPRWTRNPLDPCQRCFDAWRLKEAQRFQEIENARSPEEKTAHTNFLAELRKLY